MLESGGIDHPTVAETEADDQKTIEDLKQEIGKLKLQTEDLQQEVHRLQLQRDVLEKASELIKKDEGISLDMLSNHEKAIVIDALRDQYPLKELLTALHIAKSSYCYQKRAMKKHDKYGELRTVLADLFNENYSCYGYRRLHSEVRKTGKRVSEKVIRRLMKEEGLQVRVKRKRRYSSYQGEISPAVENLIQRDFHADMPNEKWLTDITEFSIPAGKVYLSPIIDCFDGMPVSWTIGTSPSAELANTMLDKAIETLPNDKHPIVHSDRGCHYKWPGWIQRMDEAGLTRSMSKKGCSPDNSACEGFFGRIKNEMFYNNTWMNVSIDEFIQYLDKYLHWFIEGELKN